jgi:hypothetical protein
MDKFKMVQVSAQGVQFGKCWISHERITGYSAEQLNSGHCKVTGKAYMKWLNDDQSPAFDEAAERASARALYDSGKFSESTSWWDFQDGYLACARLKAGVTGHE